MRRCAGRLDLRGAALRARQGRSARRRLHREGDARRAPRRCSRELLDAREAWQGRRRRTSAATARRASSTTSTSTTPTRTEAAPMTPTCPAPPPRESATFDRYDASPKSSAPPRPASTTSAAAAPSASCRISTTCCSSAPRSRAIRSKATARNAAPTSCSARASPRSRSSSKIPITIAGMSFGALSAQAKEALGPRRHRGGHLDHHRRRRHDAGRARPLARRSSTSTCPRATA